MNLFEIVKYGVSCREAAERYGVEPETCTLFDDSLARFTMTGIPACMWRTITTIALPAGNMAM